LTHLENGATELVQRDEARNAAYMEALALVNPHDHPKITELFSEATDEYRLLLEKEVEAAFLPISKKVLLADANVVADLAKKLSLAMTKLSKLGMPASLAVKEIDMAQDILSEFRSQIKYIEEISRRTEWLVGQFEEIDNDRTIYPGGAAGEAFDIKLTKLWLQAGHKVTSTIGGNMERYFLHAYEAATCSERDSVSRSLANAIKYIRTQAAQPSGRQKQRAGSERHRAAFEEILRSRQLKPK
jgi:hypothetical protein